MAMCMKNHCMLVHLCFSVICDLLADLRNDIGCLFKLCEVVAELDMLLSFSNLSSVSTYVRPHFGRALDIKQSRHPILDLVLQQEPVPNDVVCSASKQKIRLLSSGMTASVV
jgi:DNA mismatch repair protein MSH4